MRIKISLIGLVVLLFSQIVVSQIDLQGSYSYDELNEFLAEARKKNDRKALAASYYLLAEFESKAFERSSQALSNYRYAHEYYSLLQDSLMMFSIDVKMGHQYLESGFYQESIDLFQRAYDYFYKQQDLEAITKINFDISRAYGEKGELEKELQYLNASIALNKQLNDSLLLVEFMLRKIDSYERLNELDSAILLSLDAIKMSKMIDHDESVSKSLFHLGYLNKITSDYSKAAKYLDKALEYTPSRPFSEHRKDIYKELSEVYERTDDFEKAYNYAHRYAQLNDSILSKSRTESINNYVIKYETEEQKTKNRILEIEKNAAEEMNKQQRTAMYVLTGGLLLLLALLYYIINFYRQRMKADEIINSQKAEITQQKIRELEDNIKISSMQSMLEGQEIERERISKDLHDSLGGLLSTIKLQFDHVKSKIGQSNYMHEYENANKLLDTAVEEVRSISQNLQPGSLMKLGLIPALKDLFNRFDDEIYPDIDFQHYDVPEKIPNMIALSIYRVIQELLHNAIKHAQANEILIQINKEQEELVIQFEDDGKGFDPENLIRKGMGLENVRSRINYLKGTIGFQSNPGEGTSVLIHVRYK